MSPRRGTARRSASSGTASGEADLLLGGDDEVWDSMHAGPPAAGRFEATGPDVVSCAASLAGLDEDALTGLLAARPDLCREPVPRGVRRLAERMCGAGAVSDAIATADRDEVRLSQVIGACGGLADVATAARITSSATGLVEATAARMVARGLAWPERGGIRIPAVLAAYWTGHIDARGAAAVARTTKADLLRPAVAALGLDPTRRLKKDLEHDYVAAFDDLASVRERLARLGDRAVETADILGTGAGSTWLVYDQRAVVEAGTDDLVRAGLGVRDEWRKVTVPREVAVAAWLCRQNLELTGPPQLPAAAVGGSGQTEAATVVRAVTALLDEAATRPLAALKAGGVGTKERTRLAGLLGADVDAVTLLIAADGGRSVAGVRAALPWLHPVHPFDPAEAALQVAACLAEAAVVGVLDSDALTELGADLAAAVGAEGGAGLSAVVALAERASRLLIEEAGALVLQSDLTAMVTGKPEPDLADLLVLAASTRPAGTQRCGGSIRPEFGPRSITGGTPNKSSRCSPAARAGICRSRWNIWCGTWRAATVTCGSGLPPVF